MAELKVAESPQGYYKLQGELSRNTIAKSPALAMVEQSHQKVTSGQTIILDMLDVKHADTAGLAWLMNLLKDSRQKNIHFKFKNIPESLINLAKISDVDGFLSVQ